MSQYQRHRFYFHHNIDINPLNLQGHTKPVLGWSLDQLTDQNEVHKSLVGGSLSIRGLSLVGSQNTAGLGAMLDSLVLR